MIVTTPILRDQWKDYGDPAGNILRMKQRGELLQFTRVGVRDGPERAWTLPADALLCPSYLSFNYALSWYGLIPEATHIYPSATFLQAED